MRRADDDNGVDRRLVDERERIRVMLCDVEFGGHFLRKRADRIRDGDEPRLRDPARQVARVHAPETAEANQSHPEACAHFTLSLVTSSSFTLISSGSFSP